MENKVRLITPFLMLSAGAIASIVMYIKEYEFEQMLWVLLIVLLVFYVIGDIVRYLYASIRPKIIPDENVGYITMGRFETEDNGSVVTLASEDGGSEENNSEDADAPEDENGEYSEEELKEYEDARTEDGGYEESGEYEEAYTDGN